MIKYIEIGNYLIIISEIVYLAKEDSCYGPETTWRYYLHINTKKHSLTFDYPDICMRDTLYECIKEKLDNS